MQSVRIAANCSKDSIVIVNVMEGEGRLILATYIYPFEFVGLYNLFLSLIL